ncbi:glycosyltransferase [Pseudomonas alliivorans]|uniref:glycosyltransferase n=1 Tax=Pseudomonas alliivorans TaxID=2810613 RepID=UPI002090DC7A|nr:glycosyltransferase [Pseudomonas alliivorans]MCO5368239.1 TIGR00180 family glycosyltransferase [Pseudomonas alliivorans]MEE4621485.1 glycosyltransferase [Pseudomonas alliivorans]MEE4670404.1 glycosyltransferase [Pseudomonas alliivorans]MEE4707549.1 glycosyltransferase [Pseudomonas alliivorans]MEE4779416.1 glycosyltransferase [Pseudomonas alliivorans]
MQSHFGNEATPLNQRLTLLLLNQDQPDFLRRALKYYSNFPCSIVLVDTSSEPAAGIAAIPGLYYVHAATLAEKGLSVLLAEGLRHVTTPFVAYASVDSFLLPDALTEALSFLEDNDSYGACQGYSLSYQALVGQVDYMRRDRRIAEDYANESSAERLLSFLGQGISLLNAVTRTELARRWFSTVTEQTELHWQELGYMSYLAAAAKLRILPIPYALHHALDKDAQTRLGGAVSGAVKHIDPKARAAREAFAHTLISAMDEASGLVGEPGVQTVLEGLQAAADGLETQPWQADEKLFSALWNVGLACSEAHFEPRQFVDLPFYNQPFFDELARIEFLIHVFPAGRLQMEGLEAALLKQFELLRPQSNPDTETRISRLWQAYATYAFSIDVVQALAKELAGSADDDGEAEDISAWAQRLLAVSSHSNSRLLDRMESGRLLSWLDSRDPKPAQLKTLTARLSKQPAGSQIGILLLDLEADVFKLQATFDSLMNGHYRSFKVIVFTTGELPAATTLQNTLHFVKVTESNYVDRINQVIKQSPSDWLMLAQAGDEFTRSGLLLASAQLLDASHCRAVAVDEIQRQPNGTLAPLFRPGFNLDLLQSVPALMARHWLIRRDLLVEVGGYAREFPKALEFDLLLRLIEQGGMSGLAHLSEPLLICEAPELEDNPDEQKALTRHLSHRGYQAEVGSALPGTYKIDYRHSHRPMVSILLHSQDNLPELQQCLQSILQRTRYQRYEVLIADNQSTAPELTAWLDQQEKLSSRVRVFKAEQRMSVSALRNLVSQEAKGEYLILLDAESQIVNVGWIESLLNQAQRPEVGIVGVRLIEKDGTITQAGLVLGLNGVVGSGFVGESKKSRGYMQRLVVEQNYSAVSSACLMIGKALFDEVGGLDEGPFAEALGDVDLCLKAGQAGYLTVWTPHVQVIHSGRIDAPESASDALIGKWSAQFSQDEAYNANLSLKGTAFTLASL